jgi:hypothetical protein
MPHDECGQPGLDAGIGGLTHGSGIGRSGIGGSGIGSHRGGERQPWPVDSWHAQGDGGVPDLVAGQYGHRDQPRRQHHRHGRQRVGDVGHRAGGLLAGDVTAKADAGFISATALSGASVSLTTEVGGITATFTGTPATIQALARVGAITLHVPGGATYKVSADADVGKATVSVPQSSSSGHVITATTNVGTISIGSSA